MRVEYSKKYAADRPTGGGYHRIAVVAARRTTISPSVSLNGGGSNLKGGDFPPDRAASKGFKIRSRAIGKSFWAPSASNPNPDRLRFKSKMGVLRDVGQSELGRGAAKTTFSRILPNFYPPSSGTI